MLGQCLPTFDVFILFDVEFELIVIFYRTVPSILDWSFVFITIFLLLVQACCYLQNQTDALTNTES